MDALALDLNACTVIVVTALAVLATVEVPPAYRIELLPVGMVMV